MRMWGEWMTKWEYMCLTAVVKKKQTDCIPKVGVGTFVFCLSMSQGVAGVCKDLGVCWAKRYREPGKCGISNIKKEQGKKLTEKCNVSALPTKMNSKYRIFHFSLLFTCVLAKLHSSYIRVTQHTGIHSWVICLWHTFQSVTMVQWGDDVTCRRFQCTLSCYSSCFGFSCILMAVSAYNPPSECTNAHNYIHVADIKPISCDNLHLCHFLSRWKVEGDE